MGTSTRLRGPRGAPWSAASRVLSVAMARVFQPVEVRVEMPVRRPASSGRSTGADAGGAVAVIASRGEGVDEPSGEGLSAEDIATVGEAYLDALRVALTAEPEEFGLIDTARDAGLRLVETLSRIDDILDFRDLGGESSDQRVEILLTNLVGRIAGSGGTITDAVARQAALECATALLEESPELRAWVERGAIPSGFQLSDELFCLIYRIFFQHLITGFLQTVIAAKIQVIVPALPVLDPSGHIANWIAGKIVDKIPTPCAERARTDNAVSLADVARKLLLVTVQRTLGVPDGGDVSSA